MKRLFLMSMLVLAAGCGESLPAEDVSQFDANCVPSCDGAVCGDDGCGGSCGSCDADFKCRDGQCVCGVCGGVCGACPEIEFMPIAAGSFTMGCVADSGSVDQDCSSDELPPHRVTLQAFEAARFEVTVSDYNACVATGACLAAGADSGCNGSKTTMLNHPINCVTWDDATAFCMWVGARLASEAEWEYAARGTDGRKYPWGNQGPTCNLAWADVDDCSPISTGEVGTKPLGKSPFGVEDMAGNVSEWVLDPCHIESYDGAPVDGSVWTMDAPGYCRVNRGGGYTDRVESTMSINRIFNEKDKTSKALGIRCFR